MATTFTKQFLDVFKDTYIPFAVDNKKDMDDIYCVDALSGEIFLLWVSTCDPFCPVEWQTGIFERGKSLDIFLQQQIEMY